MEIIEKVFIKNSSDRNELYTLFVHAAQGDFKDDINSNDKDKIKEIEKLIKGKFDEFAQRMFDEGREYEKNKQGQK